MSNASDGTGPPSGEGPGDDVQDNPGNRGAIVTQTQLSPLSIQAASLVRSIEGLSNIFWISIGGTFLSIFFAGLSQLDANATTDHIYLGEYQVPRSILPLASLAFAMFTFWMTANRLNMLAFVLSSTRLPVDMVHEIFHLNPPVLHVFEKNNADTWSPFAGVSVLIFNWSVFFGNSIALTLATAAQQGASFADFDLPLLALYALITVALVVYGVRAIFPPLRRILGVLHGVDFQVGWARQVLAVLIMVGVYGANSTDLFSDVEQQDDLLGPSIANAIDGDTLFMLGAEVELFGIDAVERDQTCQDSTGADYPCGRVAMQALQSLVQHNDVICNPLCWRRPRGGHLRACQRGPARAALTGRVHRGLSAQQPVADPGGAGPRPRGGHRSQCVPRGATTGPDAARGNLAGQLRAALRLAREPLIAACGMPISAARRRAASGPGRRLRPVPCAARGGLWTPARSPGSCRLPGARGPQQSGPPADRRARG